MDKSIKLHPPAKTTYELVHIFFIIGNTMSQTNLILKNNIPVAPNRSAFFIPGKFLFSVIKN